MSIVLCLSLTVSLLEIKDIRRGKNSKDFEEWCEESRRHDATVCFVLYYTSEFKYKTLSVAGELTCTSFVVQ